MKPFVRRRCRWLATERFAAQPQPLMPHPSEGRASDRLWACDITHAAQRPNSWLLAYSRAPSRPPPASQPAKPPNRARCRNAPNELERNRRAHWANYCSAGRPARAVAQERAQEPPGPLAFTGPSKLPLADGATGSGRPLRRASQYIWRPNAPVGGGGFGAISIKLTTPNRRRPPRPCAHCAGRHMPDFHFNIKLIGRRFRSSASVWRGGGGVARAPDFAIQSTCRAARRWKRAAKKVRQRPGDIELGSQFVGSDRLPRPKPRPRPRAPACQACVAPPVGRRKTGRRIALEPRRAEELAKWRVTSVGRASGAKELISRNAAIWAT